jgi:hypothetical protein
MLKISRDKLQKALAGGPAIHVLHNLSFISCPALVAGLFFFNLMDR